MVTRYATVAFIAFAAGWSLGHWTGVLDGGMETQEELRSDRRSCANIINSYNSEILALEKRWRDRDHNH